MALFWVVIMQRCPDMDTGEFSELKFAEISTDPSQKVLLEARAAYLAVKKWRDLDRCLYIFR